MEYTEQALTFFTGLVVGQIQVSLMTLIMVPLLLCTEPRVVHYTSDDKLTALLRKTDKTH